MVCQITDCEQDQAKLIVSNQFEINYHLFAKKLSLNSLFALLRNSPIIISFQFVAISIFYMFVDAVIRVIKSAEISL